MFGYLTSLGLISGTDFYEQYPFGNYVLDFAFIQSRKPFRGVDIETDGMLWHSTPQQRSRDGYRTYKLMKSGWLIERFGEMFSVEDVQKILSKHKIKPSS
jgi:very-short-patch-repair endonuclease